MKCSKYKKLWGFEKGKIPLNHGSFGATPLFILKKQAVYRKRMEFLTTRFFVFELKSLLDESRETLAEFLNCKPENLVFLHNTTTAANTVLNNIEFKENDEILTTGFIYKACSNLLNHISKTKKVKLVFADITQFYDINYYGKYSDDLNKLNNKTENKYSNNLIDISLELKKIIISEFSKKINKKTKLIFIDHITSETAFIFPVKEIVKLAKENNIKIFIDGAHAPGQVDIDLRDLNPDYYTGNAHKWLCSPKGAAFLYISDDNLKNFNPLIISNNFYYGNTEYEQLRNKFDWQGTFDYTPFICIKDSIEYLNKIYPFGIKGIMKHNHNLILKVKKLIFNNYSKLNLENILQKAHNLESYVKNISPPDNMVGSMVLIPLFEKSIFDPKYNVDILQLKLLQKYGIETMFVSLNGYRFIRLSAYIYNSFDDYKFLLNALLEERSDK